jgi:hypothetical protein
MAAAGTALPATATRTAWPAVAWTTAPVTSAAVPSASVAITAVERFALALRPRHQVDGIEKLATLLRALRSVFALQHPHKSHLPSPSPDHVQRLHQARKTVAFHLQSRADRLGLGPCAQHRLFLRSCRGRSLGSRLAGLRLRRRCRSLIYRRRVCAGGFRWRLCLGGNLVGFRLCSRRRIRARGFSLRVLCPVCPLGVRCPLQQNSGKLSNGLHCVGPSWPMNQGSCPSDGALVVDVLSALVNGNVIRAAASSQPIPSRLAICGAKLARNRGKSANPWQKPTVLAAGRTRHKARPPASAFFSKICGQAPSRPAGNRPKKKWPAWDYASSV